ncbi:transcription factor grauzone-like [Lutzomyia longipalpis]|uniref:transcription factor grauzone-like n=1 Tax=Lutzomyia longipalpis TaxID=7200 RepID=UPI0024846F8F|nr:transcription factor grauzone-like [Lutzomyia longipalpis]
MSKVSEIPSQNAFNSPTNYNISEMCRLCLISTENKLEIFGEIGHQMNISKMIWILLNSKVLRNDSWPQNICMTCCEKLTEFHGFYSTVKSTEATLVGLCGARKTSEGSEEVSIEMEEKFIPNNEIVERRDSENPPNFSEEDFPIKVKVEISEDPDEQERLLDDMSAVEEVESKPRRLPVKTRKQKRSQKVRKQKIPSKLNALQSPPATIASKKKVSMDTLIKTFVKLSCEFCSMEFPIFEKLKRHYRDEHDTEGYVMCCSIRFENRERLLEHVRYHRNPDKYICKLCGKDFKFRNSLHVHMDTHIPPEDRKFKCTHCPKSFTMLCRLTVHEKVHVPPEEREHVCPKCKKPFASIYTLRSHLKLVHERVQKRVCEICAKVFNTRECFEAHMMRHTGQTPPRVKCQQCGKEYAERNSLRRHMQMHKVTNETFTCDQCGRITSSKLALYKHKSIVHSNKTFQCTLCEKKFKRAIVLKEHMASHTGEQLYSCKFCDRTFNSNANKYVHQKRMHPEEWEEDRRKKLEKTSSSTAN